MIELADIIAPVAPPPAPPPYEWIALGLALFALILFFVLRLWLKRTRARRWARAALKRTERELKLGKLDARAAAFEIARAVKCVGPLQKNAEEWPEFIKHLDQARFSPHPIDTQQAAQLLVQAHQWISRTP
jgi:hypothetical protein